MADDGPVIPKLKPGSKWKLICLCGCPSIFLTVHEMEDDWAWCDLRGQNRTKGVWLQLSAITGYRWVATTATA
jgi:hypothetical protein